MTNSAPIVLQSGTLMVEIAAPGTAYRGSRFDWTAFITQVTLDGKHTFCVPENYDPAIGTGGVGLCNEFGIEKCIGYADSVPGETFPKLGIGLLARPERPAYDFFSPHAISQPFTIHVDTSASQARFTVDPLDCRGYAARLVKTVSVTDAALSVDYELENTGSQPIDTHEYIHNFIGIDRAPVGPAYCLRFPYKLSFAPEIGVPPAPLSVHGSEIHWDATPAPGANFYCRPLGFARTDQAQWELFHGELGVGVREFDDFAPARVALWGMAHVISPEVFIDVHLEPGETRTWRRSFEFFHG